MEKLHGTPPDIYMFRFGFWAPVWYYEPTAKFPAPNFLPARHLGIASEHGDYFTCKVWTLPDDKQENGLELVRDIVTMRQHTNTSPRIDYKNKALTMSKNLCAKKSKRKRKSRNTELRNTATASHKWIKSCEAVNNEDTADSNADDNRHTAICFSLTLVTERTETGEKGKTEATSMTTIRQFKIKNFGSSNGREDQSRR